MVAASKPTSQLFLKLHFLTHLAIELGALIGDLGCSPFDNVAYPTLSISRTALQYSEFDFLW